MKISCRDCGLPFPLDPFPHICPSCAGLFGFPDGLVYRPEQVLDDQPGIWRYRESFMLPPKAPAVYLGEGDTPLVWIETYGKQVGYKLESLNPTGSFKDRGTAVLVSWLLAAGIKAAVEDSSGNAGASFAAYAARSKIQGKIYLPASASGPKRLQIESSGAGVVPVPGPRSNAAAAVLEDVKAGSVYASHAFLPQGTAGIASIAFELLSQSSEIPGTIVVPVGHGSLLLGVAMGFEALFKAGLIPRLPRLVGVQAAACAPLWKAIRSGAEGPLPVEQGQTIAEGVAISDPYHGRQVLAAVQRSGGTILQAAEDQILTGRRSLADLGISAEPTSALVYNGIEQILSETPEPIIAIISGHGLKSP